jgi:hypothetical protein
MKRIYITVCILLITTAAATAQNVQGQEQEQDTPKQGIRKHEMSIYSIGGYSSINYTLNKTGSTKSSFGGGAGLGYTFNINPAIGIVTGIEMVTYSGEASFDNIPDEYSEGSGTELFRFSYSLRDCRETQNLTLFSIPVMAQYSLPLGGGTTKFYASGGFKFGFPISAQAEITPGTATTSGYYAHEDMTYVNLPQHGFVSNAKLPDIKKDIDLGFSATLALETGVRFTLTDKLFLYTGLYFDYGLNNIQKVNDKHLLEYDASNESTFKYNSVLNTGLVDKVNLLSVGLKIRVSLNL